MDPDCPSACTHMYSQIFSRVLIFANQGETAKFYTSKVTNDPYHVEALRVGAYASRVDPRKLKHEKVQNPTSAKIATLENFPLYGIIIMQIIRMQNILHN